MKTIEEKLEISPVECIVCYTPVIPDLDSKNETTKEWDGHTFKFDCNHHNSKLRISIG